MSSDTTTLFTPLRLGPLTLSSRIVMGPQSSTLADKDHVLSPQAIAYYAQRAQTPGTLLIGEATFISARASGTAEARAGIYTPAQIAAWTAVVDAVHAAGSHIFLQLWALGRQADPAIKQRDNTGDVVSASTVPEQPGGAVPRALTPAEIDAYIADHVAAAQAAVAVAGFDGVEIHGGNGSLVDQFTQSVSNARDDAWGGSVANRSRFGLAIAAAVGAAIGSARVGYRVSPFSTYGGMGAPDAEAQFVHLLRGLRAQQIGYVHLVESRIAGRVDVAAGASLAPFVEAWGGAAPLIIAGGYTPQTAAQAVEHEYRGQDVAIAFSRAFVANPDLVERVRRGDDLLPA